MVIYKKGDIFLSTAQVITNPVNCVGVTGKGLAFKFKQKFPKMFEDYKARCERGKVRPGLPYLWEDESSQILIFPIKKHWSESSSILDIEQGLKYLSQNFLDMGISSLALSQLSFEEDDLDFKDVTKLIDKYFEPQVALDFYVYENSM